MVQNDMETADGVEVSAFAQLVMVHLAESAWEAAASLATNQGSKALHIPAEWTIRSRGDLMGNTPLTSPFFLDLPPNGDVRDRKGLLVINVSVLASSEVKPYSHASSKSLQNPVLFVSNDGFPSLGENHSTA